MIVPQLLSPCAQSWSQLQIRNTRQHKDSSTKLLSMYAVKLKCLPLLQFSKGHWWLPFSNRQTPKSWSIVALLYSLAQGRGEQVLGGGGREQKYRQKHKKCLLKLLRKVLTFQIFPTGYRICKVPTSQTTWRRWWDEQRPTWEWVLEPKEDQKPLFSLSKELRWRMLSGYCLNEEHKLHGR